MLKEGVKCIFNGVKCMEEGVECIIGRSRMYFYVFIRFTPLVTIHFTPIDHFKPK